MDSNGNIYVADMFNHAIRKITPSGLVSTLAGTKIYVNYLNQSLGFVDGQGTSARFQYPQGIAVDSTGNVFVSDTSNQAIRKITPSGVVSTIAGNGKRGLSIGQGSGVTFTRPIGLTIDNNGTIYVADSGNNLIRKITSSGMVSTFAGSGAGGSSSVDGKDQRHHFGVQEGSL